MKLKINPKHLEFNNNGNLQFKTPVIDGYLEYSNNDWVVNEKQSISVNLSDSSGTINYDKTNNPPSIPVNLSHLSGTINYDK